MSQIISSAEIDPVALLWMILAKSKIFFDYPSLFPQTGIQRVNDIKDCYTVYFEYDRC